MTNLFGQEFSIWDNIENLKGNHDELAKLFVDGKNPTWSFVGNNRWVVTRDVNGSNGNVTFSVYSRDSFIKSQHYFLGV